MGAKWVPRRILEGTTRNGGCKAVRHRLLREMAPLEPRQIGADPPHQLAKVRVAQLAAGARDWLHVVPSMLKLVDCAPFSDG